MGLTLEQYKNLSKRNRIDIDGASVYTRTLSASGTMFFSEHSALKRGDMYIIKEYKDRADGIIAEVIKV